jgi:HlyD family secretion protein
MIRAVLLLSVCAALFACSKPQGLAEPLERITLGPIRLEVDVEGEVRAAKSTSLNVPGRQWTRRQPIWLMADGEPVAAGDVIARFSPEQSELELSQTLVDLQRNLIARAGKQAELGGVQGRVSIDLADVAVRIGIARRYAGADFGMLARNEILDAIDNERFLGVRQDVLEWQRDIAADRGSTELAVLDAQRGTYERNAELRRANLNALELRAPHAGILMLTPNWTGEKPRVGITMMAGEVLGSLPDMSAMEIELYLPQTESQGLASGQRLSTYRVGRPEQVIETQLKWVSGSAQTRSRESPVRYITARAEVPPNLARELRLVPGQRMQGRVEVLAIDKGISVPNVAILDRDGKNIVYVRNGDRFEPREIEIGARGNARSEVRAGLVEGDLVRLIAAHPNTPKEPE